MEGDGPRTVLIIVALAVTVVAVIATYGWSSMRGGPLARFADRHAKSVMPLLGAASAGSAATYASLGHWDFARESLFFAVYVGLFIPWLQWNAARQG